ncbi:hypothetical protein [Elizabethkingia meningoseptica]|uniref:hypothetical protein n=1 Tax=Elizabethkingia meningoseptica TaxID=238 RepID=UPI0023B17C56|nr:hypothetical protein [Elizabethkingia meningoseptica]
MKRTILRASLWGVLTLSLFYSCRTDSVTTEQAITSKEKIAAFERFERENNIIKPIASNDQNTSSAKYVSYAYPFAQVIYNFLQNHPDYAKKVENEAGTIRLDVVSQTFGQNKKSVIFPVVNNQGEVVGAWAGILNENRDYVSFYYLDNSSSQNVAATKAAFQAYYDKKYGKITNQAIASVKGINPIALAPLPPPKVPVQTIQEVVINVPAPDLTVSSSWLTGAGGVNYGNTLGGGMSGGPTTHGGAGNGTPSNGQQDPCSKMKSKIATEKGRIIIKDLEAKAKTPGAGETAYRQDKNGDTKMYVGEQDNVSIPIDNNMEGVYHNHPPGGINMLSVKDIRMMLFAARMQSDDNVGNAYVGMISNSGNYFVSFNGTKADIPVIYDNQIPDLRKAYERDYLEISMFPANGKNPSSEQLEQFFFKTIDNMGLTGKVNLIKEKDGATSVVKQDANGKPVTSDPC